CELLLEYNRRKNHDNHRTTVIGKCRNANANLFVCLKQKHPTYTHCNPRDYEGKEMRFVFPKLHLLFRKDKYERQKQSTDECPRKYNFMATHCDVTCNNAI